MGAKSSKGKVKWSEKEDSVFADAAVSFEEMSLERSTAYYRKQNLIGLPEEIVALIAVHVSRKDIKSMRTVALVCKTWRRISYKENVWRAIAQDRGIEIVEGDKVSVRVQVLNVLSLMVKDDFIWLPQWAQKDLLDQPYIVYDGNEVFKLCLLSCYSDFGMGKTSLAFRFVSRDFFSQSNYVSDGGGDNRVFRKELNSDASVTILDTTQDEWFDMRDIRQQEAFFFCDTFDSAKGVTNLEHMLKDLSRWFSLEARDTPCMAVVRCKSDEQKPFYGLREVMQLCAQYQMPLYCCSAKEGINTDRVFKDMCLFMKKRHPKHIPRRYD